MIEITPPKTKQILITYEESHRFRREIEEAFIKLDTETNSVTCYHLSHMREKYPVLAELFIIVGGGN
jgi:hypothetical protein